MKEPLPNDFPREGQHNTVTAAGVKQMERERPHHTADLEYTIGGSVEAQVHTTIEAERTYSMNRGHRILNQASNDLGGDLEGAARKPLALDFKLVREKAEAHLERRSQAQSHAQEETP